MFHTVQGGSGAWWGYLIGSFAVSLVFIALLQLIPQNLRRYFIMGITFLGGLFFALEFFLPVHPMPTAEDAKRVGNLLTPYVVPLGEIFPVITGWSVGLGVINLVQAHSKRILKGAPGAFNSVVLFVSMIAIFVIEILKKIHPYTINKNLSTLFVEGALASLDATMFSIVAFYIVSAAYRAFRVRSVEATLLLVTAVVVMIGQVALGQMLTSWLPTEGFLHNLRVEVIRDWIMTKANAPAIRAVQFGLGIGTLAVALRIWLGLERGSYFER